MSPWNSCTKPGRCHLETVSRSSSAVFQFVSNISKGRSSRASVCWRRQIPEKRIGSKTPVWNPDLATSVANVWVVHELRQVAEEPQAEPLVAAIEKSG